jgi:hypothetical protein
MPAAAADLYQTDFKRLQMMQALHRALPKNQFDLPELIWRVDMLSPGADTDTDTDTTTATATATAATAATESGLSAFVESGLPQAQNQNQNQNRNQSQSQLVRLQDLKGPGGLTRKQLDNAAIPLHYSEGFPQLPSGFPFWDRLEFEPHASHSRFQVYLKLAGLRQIHTLYLQPSLLQSVGLPPAHMDQLQEDFYFYYWPQRARAYDLFQAAHRSRQKENLIQELELEHFAEASALKNRVLEVINGDEDFFNTLTPAAAIKLLQTAVQWQRVSLGLPAFGPATPNKSDLPAAPSVDILLKSIVHGPQSLTRPAGAAQGDPQKGPMMLDGDGNPIDDVASMQRKILENPELAEIAQELILRVHTK